MRMLRRKISNSENGGSVPVYLNVYDLTPINVYAYWFGLGVYHSGIQVHGVEFAFGAHEFPTTGIFEGEPKQCEGFKFRRTILVGKTDKEIAEVRSVMEELAGEYRGNSYNLISKNCNHFCNDLCMKLTGNSIPRWVNRLARIGLLCNCVIPATLNSTKIRIGHQTIEDKGICEEEKKEFKSQSIKEAISSSYSSASSSPCPTIHRGRSRTRRPFPPPSPLFSSSSSTSCS